MNRRPPSRGLSDDDLLVWRAVARTATPLKGKTIPADPPAAPGPKAGDVKANAGKTAAGNAGASTRRQNLLASASESRERKRPAPPAEISGEKRVRRGQVEVDARIDLHGMTLTEARGAIGRFVAHHRAQGARVVLVITGKGRAGEGAIRRALPGWLSEEAAHVTGYATAHARHGGSGAVYVRLRRLTSA